MRKNYPHFRLSPTPRSKTGIPGVYRTGGRNGKVVYQARLVIDGKERYLGAFKTIKEAAAVRKKAEQHYYGGNPNAI